MNRRGMVSLLAAILLLALLAACAPAASQSGAEGGFEGTVTNVREDGVRMQLADGTSVNIDMWSACGDRTRSVVNTGDQITVVAVRDGLSLDAQTVSSANGEILCEATGGAGEAGTVVGVPAADITYEGTVARAWQDGLELTLADGRSVLVDTWNVCGDNTSNLISTGDQITVMANRDAFSYDAKSIANANGDPACEAVPTDLDELRNTDGAFEGTVTNVREDGLTMELSDGRSVRIDTWNVCGDRTARYISTGDQLVVGANRDGLSYDAQTILTADGAAACEAAATDLDGLRNSAGAFEGTVTNVREDGLRMELSDGSTVRVDTWAVCGDNTARNISVGDQIVVEADRDGLGYDAVQILNANGEPACPRR